ncbi:hypothetical protein BC628DRAFT_386865 [Trametes gibbosa]|nr:hypothetical protein BC628DRAFT_386865 [Trametes gibbosa]
MTGSSLRKCLKIHHGRRCELCTSYLGCARARHCSTSYDCRFAPSHYRSRTRHCHYCCSSRTALLIPTSSKWQRGEQILSFSFSLHREPPSQSGKTSLIRASIHFNHPPAPGVIHKRCVATRSKSSLESPSDVKTLVLVVTSSSYKTSLMRSAASHRRATQPQPA